MIRGAAWAGFELNEDAGILARLFNALFVQDGGVDPSYATTLIPLVAVPLISICTAKGNADDTRFTEFYERLSRES